MSVDQNLGIVRKAFPDPFVAHLLQISTDDIEQVCLSPAQASGLALMAQFAEAIVAESEDSERRNKRRSILCSAPDLTGSTVGLASHIRASCGGESPPMEDGHPLERAFLAYLWDVLPVQYIEDSGHHYEGLGELLRDHPIRRTLISAIYADRSLRKLFSENPERPEELAASPEIAKTIWTHVTFKTGSGTPIFLERLPEQFLSYTLNLAALHGDISAAALFRHARGCIEVARKLALGKEVLLPQVLGFSHLKIENAKGVALAHGYLRPVDDLANRYLGIVSAIRPRAVSSILIASRKEKILSNRREPMSFDDYRGDFERSHTEVRRLSDTFTLALLLGNTADSTPTPVEEFETHLNPFDSVFSAGSKNRLFRLDLQEYCLSADNLDEVAFWSRRVVERHPISMDISMRRIISAVTYRIEAMDAFIDAVMVWENLFGDKTDTTFKVCGSIALLLEPENAESRWVLFKRLKKLYLARSDLVHGSLESEVSDAHVYRNEAVQIAFRAMRRIYNLPQLLSMKPPARTSALMLQMLAQGESGGVRLVEIERTGSAATEA